jgi:hypothetical protein
MSSPPPEGSDYPPHQRIPRPKWFDNLPEPAKDRLIELLLELSELAGQLRQLGDIADLDITVWDEQDRGSATSALRSLAALGRENAALHARLADCYERMANAIARPSPESNWHEEPEEPTGGEG